MNILIIGGTGLISTALTTQLLARGDRVTLFNRGQTPSRVPPGATVVTGDRRDFPAFEATVRSLPTFDAVIDMVCFRPEEARSLTRACAGRTAQVVFCSTVDVYSKPPDRFPVTEGQLRQARSDYGWNKRLCEDLLLEAHGRGDFAVTLLRPAHTYGEGGSLIHTFGWGTFFLDRLRRGLPVIVHGDGSSLWVSCHVDDVARGFVGALGNPLAAGRAYHLTGEEWNTWNRYTEIVAEAVSGPPPRIVHLPTDLLYQAAPDPVGVTYANFQYSNIFDNSAARADLGFRPTIPLREGARRTVRWLEAAGRIEEAHSCPVYDRLLEEWERLSAALVANLAPPAR